MLRARSKKWESEIHEHTPGCLQRPWRPTAPCHARLYHPQMHNALMFTRVGNRAVIGLLSETPEFHNRVARPHSIDDRSDKESIKKKF